MKMKVSLHLDLPPSSFILHPSFILPPSASSFLPQPVLRKPDAIPLTVAASA
jgi:hypothetical protein